MLPSSIIDNEPIKKHNPPPNVRNIRLFFRFGDFFCEDKNPFCSILSNLIFQKFKVALIKTSIHETKRRTYNLEFMENEIIYSTISTT